MGGQLRCCCCCCQVVVVVGDAAVVIRRVASWQCHERTMVMVLALKKVYDEKVVGG